MPFEELPADYKSFFDTGELPEGLKAEQEAAAAEAVKVATDAKAEEDAAAKAIADAAAEDAAKVAAAAKVDPAPTDNPYLERLLAEQERQKLDLQKQLAEMQGKIKEMTAVKAPDPETDPLGYMTHQTKQLAEQIESLKAEIAGSAKASSEEKQVQQFFDAVNSSVKAFEATHPDYSLAYKHLVNIRTQDFRDMGMTAEQAKNAVGQEEIQIAQRALQQGKNPGEVAYGMAKRYGYVTTAVTGTTAAVTAVDDKLATIKKGLDAGKEATRGNVKIEPSLASLKDASDSDLDKMVQNDWETIFGKPRGIFG